MSLAHRSVDEAGIACSSDAPAVVRSRVVGRLDPAHAVSANPATVIEPTRHLDRALSEGD